MGVKSSALQWIRKRGWMYGFDRLYFRFSRLRHKTANERFRATHPDFVLPPDYMLYEAYRLDYQAYYEDGKATARWLTEALSPHVPSHRLRILEWGCGPARIIRHLPALLPGADVQGTDYNAETVAWCQATIAGITFSRNGLMPPLAFPAERFDMVYALSVLTHLSEANHFHWLDELWRVLAPRGLALLTTQGTAFSNKLVAEERRAFDSGELVVRGGVPEGHRSFSAFQPRAFMLRLFENKWKVVEFREGGLEDWGPAQDTWIIQKTAVPDNKD